MKNRADAVAASGFLLFAFFLSSFCFFPFFFLLFSFLFFLLLFLSGDAGNTVAGRLQLVELIQHRNKERADGTWVDISVACHKLLAYGNDKTAL